MKKKKTQTNKNRETVQVHENKRHGNEEGMDLYLRILVSRFPFVSDSWQIINYYENIFTRKLLQVEFHQYLVLKSDAKWR